MDTIGRGPNQPPTREEVGRILSEHPCTEGMDAGDLARLIDIAETAHFETGKLVFQEGQHADYLYLIVHGSVALEVFNLDQEGLVIQCLEDGDVLGTSWFIPPYRWRFDAKANGPTDVIKIPADKLTQICEDNTEFGYHFMKRMAAIVDRRLNSAKEHLLNAYVFHR